MWSTTNRKIIDYPSNADWSLSCVAVIDSRSRSIFVEEGADDGIRTRDLRFTKPLLYQLSYVGGKTGKTLHPATVHTSALL